MNIELSFFSIEQFIKDYEYIGKDRLIDLSYNSDVDIRELYTRLNFVGVHNSSGCCHSYFDSDQPIPYVKGVNLSYDEYYVVAGVLKVANNLRDGKLNGDEFKGVLW